MYSIVQKAKAAVLRNDITVKELFKSAGIPDTISDKKNRLAANIAAYNNLVLGESRDSRPDSNKLRQWKDDLFSMHREMERLTAEINRDYPDYLALMQKTDPVPLEEVQKHLRRHETIVEYLISNRYVEGKRDLYIFVITKNGLNFLESRVDSLFSINSSLINDACRHPDLKNYREFTDALEYMYRELIKPVELFFTGKNLIIVPDEEIGWLPFDALLNEKPGPGSTDYEGLPYLINKYSISYSYFSSLIFSNFFPVRKKTEVFSFVPYYDVNNNSGPVTASLTGTGTETRSIYRWFRGKIFEGEQATETNFRLAIRKPAVFHLAMHSISDSTDSRYSYLLFDSNSDTTNDGKLYNYEISLSRLTSPMVVLSACNSGTGTLYHGEGLMSLARGFILAGASSVIRTAWEVNDEVSADIISRFYMHLSGGRRKDDALRMAKLEYLKESPPVYSDPYYWAAYEVLGNNAPVRRHPGRFLFAGLGSIILCVCLILYLRRRRIFSDRSL
jgi:CHAT domain-containing protein